MRLKARDQPGSRAHFSLAQGIEIVPRKQAAIMAVVKHQPDRIAADGAGGGNLDVFLAGHGDFLVRSMALDFGARAFDPERLERDREGISVIESDM